MKTRKHTSDRGRKRKAVKRKKPSFCEAPLCDARLKSYNMLRTLLRVKTNDIERFNDYIIIDKKKYMSLLDYLWNKNNYTIGVDKIYNMVEDLHER